MSKRVVFEDPRQLKQSAFVRRAGQAFLNGEGSFRDILDVLPAAVYVTDPAGHITYYNAAAAALWGHHPILGESQWCGSWKLFWPDGSALPHDQCPMSMALKEGRSSAGIEAAAERPDGTRVPFMAYPTLLHDKSGAIIGAVNMLMEITERKRAEEHAQHLAAIVASSEDAIVSKDLNGIIASWNRLPTARYAGRPRLGAADRSCAILALSAPLIFLGCALIPEFVACLVKYLPEVV